MRRIRARAAPGRVAPPSVLGSAGTAQRRGGHTRGPRDALDLTVGCGILLGVKARAVLPVVDCRSHVTGRQHAVRASRLGFRRPETGVTRVLRFLDRAAGGDPRHEAVFVHTAGIRKSSKGFQHHEEAYRLAPK